MYKNSQLLGRCFVFSLLALFAGFLVSFAGCGGGAGNPAASASPGSSAGLPPTTTPAAPTAPAPPEPLFSDLRILVIGQSIASNCNQYIYGESPNVFQVGLDGSIKVAKDPFEWADCSTGSMWMPLGKKIIESGLAKKVTFMPIGVGGSAVADWLQNGKYFPKLNNAISLIKQKGISFDFAFWHQGSSDIGSNKDVYSTNLASVVGYVNANVQIKRWLIALHSRCWGMYDPNIEQSQRIFGTAPEAGRYVGPNTNLLGDEFRVDTCHLNRAGQDAMADKWLESMKAALGK